VRAGVGEIMERARTLVIGKRQDDPLGSRNLPIKSWKATRIRNALPSVLADSMTVQIHSSKDPDDGKKIYQ
jgi:hypothetical protein